MRWLYQRVVRPVLFLQDAESIHERTVRALALVGRHRRVCRLVSAVCGAGELPVERFGLRFPNPIGLAAGMDKAAAAVPAWEALGFGFAELGGVTWLAQPGNPKPRIFRAILEESIVNRMGFNNPGAEAVGRSLEAWRRLGRWPAHPVGMNLGKSKDTPLDGAAEDYARSFRALRRWIDFFVVNVSSPNTPGLRRLQDKTALGEILAAVQEENRRPVDPTGAGTIIRPVLVKVAPDLCWDALDDILELVEARQVSGIVATNTTVERPESRLGGVRRVYAEEGGLSGRPLRARSTEVIRHLHRQSGGRVPIVGVGGVFSAADAWEKVLAGASLLQIYTGLVFEGPTLARRIVRGLAERLRSEGLERLDEAVGRG
jgi:dihydroorotate dehydrogenase